MVGDDDEGAGAQRVGQLGGQRGEEEEEGADGREVVLRLEDREVEALQQLLREREAYLRRARRAA